MLEKLLLLIEYYENNMGPPQHVYYSDKPSPDLAKRNILQVRDIRDTLVSLVFHVDKIASSLIETGISKHAGFSNEPQKWSAWQNKSFDDKLMDAIHSNNATEYDFNWASKEQWEEASRINKNLPHYNGKVILTKFENLVGPNGGGSLAAQAHEINRIAQHLDFKFSDEKISEMQEKLWGGTDTFNKGQIGRWKHYFKPEHVKAFLPIFQKYLEEFDYEPDATWSHEYLNK